MPRRGDDNDVCHSKHLSSSSNYFASEFDLKIAICMMKTTNVHAGCNENILK